MLYPQKVAGNGGIFYCPGLNSAWLPGGDVNVNGLDFAHSRSKGWNVLFRDPSVEFKNVNAQRRAAYARGGFNNGQYDLKGICDLARFAFE